MSHRAGEQAQDVQLLTTYRYLRMALVTVLALLAFAVALEMFSSAGPPLTSISEYYWTPVRSVFVGAMVALGVGMIVIKADNELEDIFLNVGGVLAPIVAFVPTAQVGTCATPAGGGPPPALPAATVDAITNNVSALLAAGVLALLIFLALVRFAPGTSPGSAPLPRGIRLARLIGTLVVVALLVTAWVWFNQGRASFECHAHDAAAVCLFVCILAVTGLNAVSKFLERRTTGVSRLRAALNGYTILAVLMAVVVAVGGATFSGWAYAILFVEAGVLALFLVFWVTQSAELWNRGVRHVGRKPRLAPQAPVGS